MPHHKPAAKPHYGKMPKATARKTPKHNGKRHRTSKLAGQKI